MWFYYCSAAFTTQNFKTSSVTQFLVGFCKAVRAFRICRNRVKLTSFFSSYMVSVCYTPFDDAVSNRFYQFFIVAIFMATHMQGRMRVLYLNQLNRLDDLMVKMGSSGL